MGTEPEGLSSIPVDEENFKDCGPAENMKGCRPAENMKRRKVADENKIE